MPRATHSSDLPSKYCCALKQVKDGLHVKATSDYQYRQEIIRSKELTAEQSLKKVFKAYKYNDILLTHNSGQVTQICVFNTVKLGTSASSP